MLASRWFVVVALIAIGAAARLLPHPPNVTPIAALGLFAGACLPDRRLALLVPLLAMALSDLALGVHPLTWIVYVAMLPTVALGWLLQRRRTVVAVGGASVAGSLLFFVVTNFAVWAHGLLYPHTLQGLQACYIAALPFLDNSLAGDLVFAGLLFGGLALAERVWPILRERPGVALQETSS